MNYMLIRVCFASCLTFGIVGACTYSNLNLNLYDCFDTRSLTTEYALPVMASTIDAATFCTGQLSAIKSCVEAAIQACSGTSKVTQFYGDGTELSAAYTYLCDEFTTYNSEPFSCAASADMGNVKLALSDFDTAVDALTNPTVAEICLLADSMTESFTNEIASVCSASSTSVSIWNTYTSRLKSSCSGFSLHLASSLLFVLSVVASLVLQV